MWWIYAIVAFYVISFIWMAYEIYRAPLMPPEYDDEYADIFKDDDTKSTLK